MRRGFLLLVLVAVAAGCGGSSRSSQPTTTASAPTTTAAATEMPLIVYRPNGAELEAERVSVPRTKAVARAALRELGISGVTSLRIADGTATLDLGEPPAGLALAQVVFTLTEFPTVQQVAIGDRTLTRTDLDRYAPPILVVEPQPGDTVSSPLRVHGNADTFEATFELELVDAAGTVVAHRTVTATSGSGERGSFDVTVSFSDAKPGRGKLVAFETSAENGQRIHVVEIPVVLS
jgi:Immunoglobulin-like domain of bacterial spore germination/Sporulation and spore germination